jgi:hypothetical protein
MILSRGTTVNLLEHIKSPTPEYVRVQFVSFGKKSRPGFVKTDHLEAWYSTHPTAAWEFLRFLRPADGATEEELRSFAEELRKFGERFPGTPQADQTYLEAAQRYIKLHQLCRNSGKAPAQCDSYLARAYEALERVTPRNVVARAELRRQVSTITQAEKDQEQANQAEVERQERITALKNRIYAAHRRFHFPEMCALANEMAKLDPQQAEVWKKAADELLLTINPNGPGCK